ncbi:hypothetical protein SLA2020_343290, partial [Shorea laevis]
QFSFYQLIADAKWSSLPPGMPGVGKTICDDY